MKTISSRACALVLPLLLSAAIYGITAEKQGMLELRIKDHREAIGDFSKLTLTIEQILVSPKAGVRFWQSGWKSLPTAAQSIDLTKYTGKNSARVFRSTIDPASFDAIHLKLGKVDGTLKKGKTDLIVKNLLGPVKLDFDVQPQGETLIVLDLVVLDMSDHPPRAYELALRGYELYTNGKLTDKIPPGA
jgi:hypothetical protein